MFVVVVVYSAYNIAVGNDLNNIISHFRIGSYSDLDIGLRLGMDGE